MMNSNGWKALAASLALLVSACMTESRRQDEGGRGDARVTVKLNKTGALGKVADIEMSALVLSVSADGEETRLDTIAISGNEGQTISEVFEDLVAGKTWTLSAVASDTNQVEIYWGSTEFTVTSGTTEEVSLVLASRYSMLKALFYPVRDSVTRLELSVDGSLVADVSFEKQSRVGDTVLLAYDYLPAAPSGEPHTLLMEAWGEWDGEERVLYRGEVDLSVVSGNNVRHALQLDWAGPGAPPRARMNVHLDAIYRTSVDGYLVDAFGPDWRDMTAPGFAPATLIEALVVDGSNRPWAAFVQESGGKATIMRWNGSAWAAVGGVAFTPGRADDLTLVLDSNDVPYIAFRDESESFKLTVMRFDDGAWEVVGDAGFTPAEVNDPCITLDPDGVPYVSYGDGSDNSRVLVKRWNGTTWEGVGSYLTATPGGSSTIRIDSAGTIYVGYIDFTVGHKPTVKRWNGSSWELLGSEGFGSGYSAKLDFELDRLGRPWVASSDGTDEYRIKVFAWDGGDWEILGSGTDSPGKGGFPSIAFSDDNTPHVAFADVADFAKAVVKHWTGTAWATLGRPGISLGISEDVPFAIGRDGVPYAGSDPSTVKRYVGPDFED